MVTLCSWSRLCPGDERPPLSDPLCHSERGGVLLVPDWLHGPGGKLRTFPFLLNFTTKCFRFEIFIWFYWHFLPIGFHYAFHAVVEFAVCLESTFLHLFARCVFAASELWGVAGGHEAAAPSAQHSSEGSGPRAVRLPGLVLLPFF